MENLKTEKVGEVSDILLIALYQNHPEIDSRIDFFKAGINSERFPEEIQVKFGQRVIAFQKDIDTISVVSGADIEQNLQHIAVSDENEDIYESSVNPNILLGEEDSDLNYLV